MLGLACVTPVLWVASISYLTGVFMASEFGGVTPSKEVRAIYLDRYLSVLKNLREKYEEMPPRPQNSKDKNKF